MLPKTTKKKKKNPDKRYEIMLFKIVYVRQQKTKTPENTIQTRQYQQFPQLAALREILSFRTGRTQGETDGFPECKSQSGQSKESKTVKVHNGQSAREKEP